MKEVEKREVEDLLENQISDDQFNEAYEYAKRKQAYIYSREKRPVVLQHGVQFDYSENVSEKLKKRWKAYVSRSDTIHTGNAWQAPGA